MEEGAPRTVENDQGKIDLMAPGIFPYSPRPFQMEIVAAIRGSMSAGEQLVMESGTGTGKTVCALVGALEYAKDRKKVIYLTRTISQSDQVIKELRNISKKRKVTGLPVLGGLGHVPFYARPMSWMASLRAHCPRSVNKKRGPRSRRRKEDAPIIPTSSR